MIIFKSISKTHLDVGNILNIFLQIAYNEIDQIPECLYLLYLNNMNNYQKPFFLWIFIDHYLFCFKFV